MLTQLRNTWQRLRIPSFIRALRNFDLHHARNTHYPDCESGQIAWADLPRSQIKINGKDANFAQAINAYKTPENNRYRKVLHEIFNSKFQEISNQNVSGPLIDECVTILNQASLYGSSIKVLQLLGKDMQARMHLNTLVVPVVHAYNTKIETISGSNLTVEHTEQLTLRDMSTGYPISKLSTTICFNMSSDQYNTVTYSNPTISLEIPQKVAPTLLPINSIRMANMLVPLSNAVSRIRSLFTGVPFQKITPYEIIRTNNASIITHKLPHYRCIPVTIPDIENQKEKHKQKQKSQYQTRSTFIRPHPSEEDIRKPTGNSNKDSKQQQNKPLNVSAEIHETKIQPQKQFNTESRSL
ncbi:MULTISPECIES: hypothetical protein [Ehrlichia]|uniref:Uncharacterized protein n=1 Tax=Ehrlichia cf. muris str. EmCRT TaxID=1359167 RepID=A0A0F3NCS8_9RICK|nr:MULTISPECIES: hypothetical protein [Ehrlichia]KJV65840.1 hypothetical protein EMUCRT_0020 [Ehrlichia cf. muris str. EmCRT]OUC04089.1 hypothetical protein DB91_01635 [Ehrlichia sp. Wisconsin_h]